MGRMHDAPLISPENKDSAADVVAKLPKVSLFETISSTAATPEELTATIRERYEALAADGVVYAELHLDPAEIGLDAAAVAEAAADARIAGLDSRIVLVGSAPEEAVPDNAPVVGYSLPQGQASGAADFRAAYLPTQILVGEDFAEVERAAQSGVNRLIHPVNMIDDFTANIEGIVPGKASGYIRDRHIPLVFTPLEEAEELTPEEFEGATDLDLGEEFEDVEVEEDEEVKAAALADMAEGSSFHRVLRDDAELRPSVAGVTLKADKDIRRVILCSGKVYYDLLDAREKAGIDDIALVRLEQFYPFPAQSMVKELSRFKDAEIVWCQEEPKNMGGWTFVEPNLEWVLSRIGAKHGRARYVGRAASASPATGLASRHKAEQEALVNEAITIGA